MSSRLILAFALSFALHGVLLFPDVLKRFAATPAPRALQATLRLPPKALPPDALLKNTLDEAGETAAKTPPPRPSPPPRTSVPHRELRAAQRKIAEHLFYPPEAVARGLEGEVQLILRLADDGSIERVTLAASSGHTILDNAAIRAAYAVGRFGNGGARELILPVIFRLQ